MLKCDAICCRVLITYESVAHLAPLVWVENKHSCADNCVSWSVLKCFGVSWSVLKCLAVSCCVLQCLDYVHLLSWHLRSWQRNAILCRHSVWNLLSYTRWYTLQHTATHCNTLQPTATSCNSLQQTPLQLAAVVLAEESNYVQTLLLRETAVALDTTIRDFLSSPLAFLRILPAPPVLSRCIECVYRVWECMCVRQYGVWEYIECESM